MSPKVAVELFCIILHVGAPLLIQITGAPPPPFITSPIETVTPDMSEVSLLNQLERVTFGITAPTNVFVLTIVDVCASANLRDPPTFHSIAGSLPIMVPSLPYPLRSFKNQPVIVSMSKYPIKLGSLLASALMASKSARLLYV